MKTFNKVITALLLLIMAQSASAQEAYAILTLEDNYYYESEIESYIYDGTLTFYYDDQKSSHLFVVVFDINPDDEYPAWVFSPTTFPPNFTPNIKCRITKAVFDPSFAEARPTSTQNWFLSDYDRLGMSNCYAIVDLSEIVGIQYLNTTDVTNMDGMFEGNKNLTSLDLGSFDTHNVTDMYNMFYNCSNLSTIYVGDGWDTSNVQDGRFMFADCVNLVGGQGTTYDQNHTGKEYAHIDGGSDNPGYLTLGEKPYVVFQNNTLTFYYDNLRASRQGTIYELNTSYPGWLHESITDVVFDKSFQHARPTTTREWFYGLKNLVNIDGVENLNTSEVTDMNGMFHSCSALTSLDLSGWDTGNVTNMSFMFSGCALTSLDLSKWDTGNVTYMYDMFSGCALTSLDLSGWDTGNVIDISRMFMGCRALTRLELSKWDTGNIGGMGRVFYGCSALTSLDLSGWDTGNVNDMLFMFRECENLVTIYVGDGWVANGVTQGMFFRCYSLVGGQGTTYGEHSQMEDGEYAHIDGGPDNPGYLSRRETYTALKDGTLTFYNDGKKTMQQAAGASVTLIPNDLSCNWQGENVTKVVFDESFAQLKPTSTRNWLKNFRSLTDIEGLENLNTSEVTDMRGMFCYCQSLNSLDLSSLDTHNVTKMDQMFHGCSGLTSLDVSGWDTGNVTEMENMFYGCRALTSLDLSGWDTGNVTTMSNMFGNCISLTSLDLRSFDTSQVEFMDNMFSTCIALTEVNLSNFATGELGNTERMFISCRSLTSLDLSSFDTHNLNYMKQMFSGCDVLRTIYVSPSWITKSTSETYDMFLGCPNLCGGQGTVYDPDHVNGSYAHIDGGPDNPGYFSEKTAIPTSIRIAEVGIDETAPRYNLSGQRVSQDYKGITIMNGRKVVR